MSNNGHIHNYFMASVPTSNRYLVSLRLTYVLTATADVRDGCDRFSAMVIPRSTSVT